MPSSISIFSSPPDDIKVGDSYKEQDQTLTLHGGGMTEDEEDIPLCGGSGTEDDDNSKVGDSYKEQDQTLPLRGGGMTEDNEDIPLCGGGRTEDDDNIKVGNKNKEQNQPLPLHGGGVKEDNKDLPICGGGRTEDDDTLTENSTMSSITRASKGNKISDLTDNSTVLTNEDSINRLMIWNDKYVKLLDDGGWKCLWCKKIFKFCHSARALCHFLKLKGNHVTI